MTQTITCYRREDIAPTFTMDPVENITGWTLLFSVAAQPNDTVKLFQKTPTITSGPAGTFQVAIANEDTDREPGTYAWDVRRTDAGSERVLALGNFVINATAGAPS